MKLLMKNFKESKPQKFVRNHVLWILIFAMIAANFAVSIALIPAIISIKGENLFLILAITGIFFGLLFELVIRSVEHFDKRHHIFLGIIMPLIAIANFLFITRMASSISLSLDLGELSSPILIPIIYAISFTLPYILSKFILGYGYYSSE